MTNAESLIGQQIASFKITAHLAQGGMADVYLADDVGLRRQAVLKIMLPHLASNEAFIARFQREARTTARLDHPNIIKVYSTALMPDGRPYLAMQYIRGGTLHEKLHHLAAQKQTLPIDTSLTIMRQVAAALSVAHSAGIVHRDLKPSNILLHENGTPVLTDLGIAAVESTTRLTQTGEVMGTPFYMSPEQALGKAIDGRSDIYSLGVILYEMLAGSPPFQATSPLAVLHKHIYEPPPLLITNRDDLSPITTQIVEVCLRKDPAQRYQTANELVAALDRALAGEAGGPIPPYAPSTAPTVVEEQAFPPPPPVTPPFTSPASPSPRSNNRRWLLLLPLVLILCVAAALFIREPIWAILAQSSPTPIIVIQEVTTTFQPPTATSIPAATVPAETAPTATETIAAPPTLTSTPVPEILPAPSATVPSNIPSENSGRIVFNSNRDGDHEIYIMEADGSNQRQLTANSADDEHSVISPDGRQIVFESQRDGNLEVYVMNIDGSNQRRLTNHSSADRLPTWSPDGTQIAFISQRSGNTNLHIMNADGSNVRQLTNDSRHEGHPSWSVNNEIVYNAGDVVDDTTWEIYVIDVNYLNQRQLTSNSIRDWSPEWSPDGRRILFLRYLNEDDGASIYIMDANGSNGRLLYNSPDYDWGQAWAPDGRRILFTREIDNFSYIYTMDAAGSNVTYISDRGRYPKEVP